MDINVNIIILIGAIMLYIVIFLLIRILINKFSSLDEMFKRNNRRLSLVLSLVHNEFKGNLESLRDLKSIRQNIVLEGLSDRFDEKKIKRIEHIESRKIKSYRTLRRKEAAIYLGIIATNDARRTLENALLKEKNYSVKIYISNALTDIRNPESLDYMVKGIIGTHKWYREKAISNILEFGNHVEKYFEDINMTGDIEIIELGIMYCAENYSNISKKFLLGFIDNFDVYHENLKEYYEKSIMEKNTSYKLEYLKYDMDRLLELACRTMSNIYYNDFVSENYYQNSNWLIQRNGLWALAKVNLTKHFKIILEFLRRDDMEKMIINIASKMIESNPRFIYLVEDMFYEEKDEVYRGKLAKILSKKIEYYILQLNKKNEHRANEIISNIIEIGKVNELIGFMNSNKDVDIENRLVSIIKSSVVADSPTEKEFRIYLEERIIEKLNYERIKNPKAKKVLKRDLKLKSYVLRMMLLSVATFPIVFFILNKDLILYGDLMRVLKKYVINFNYILAFYSISINSIYLILLVFSYVNVRKQSKLWSLKNVSMLFRNKMIPSISIIAPAYNEEKTIIASVQSLLNLNYPDYELIVVNDGSTDDTLIRLISDYKLSRTEYSYENSLDTAPIRGIYRNPSFPKLIVVDKSNGGKADSLNAGINVANKVYFCGIDADSLLEPDSLLKLSSTTLDESCETPALGGNIFPINGCVVDKGLIKEIKVPDSNLAKFQTVEYIRSFMAGRMGWQKLNSLLIISGAFGLFRKDRIIDVGGYLTEKGKYNKDTVGEDMELIVRISRLLHEKNRKFKILYSFNANAWTEVPEDIKSLRNQRFRWHRGLIEILHFHKKMFLNKNYGGTGFMAMPYFLLFEFIGPMIEIQGYIMVLLAAFLGILDGQIALLLFMSTILYGVIVSLSSLLIAERETHYFTINDLFKLIFFSVIENFGPRQIISYWRIRGQIGLLKGDNEWGDIKRRGVYNE